MSLKIKTVKLETTTARPINASMEKVHEVHWKLDGVFFLTFKDLIESEEVKQLDKCLDENGEPTAIVLELDQYQILKLNAKADWTFVNHDEAFSVARSHRFITYPSFSKLLQDHLSNSLFYHVYESGSELMGLITWPNDLVENFEVFHAFKMKVFDLISNLIDHPVLRRPTKNTDLLDNFSSAESIQAIVFDSPKIVIDGLMLLSALKWIMGRFDKTGEELSLHLRTFYFRIASLVPSVGNGFSHRSHGAGNWDGHCSNNKSPFGNFVDPSRFSHGMSTLDTSRNTVKPFADPLANPFMNSDHSRSAVTKDPEIFINRDGIEVIGKPSKD